MKNNPSGPWGISIRTSKKSIMKVVPQREGETLRSCLERTKKAVRKIKKKYAHRDDLIVEIISRRVAFKKPEDLRLKHNHLWCPYCRKARQFKTGQVVEIDGITYVSSERRCVVCQMSDNDYYVKTYNHLWPQVKVK